VTEETNQKVKATHLKRNAYLYIRQSTPRQVIENTESTKRQYALRQRAVALGWPEDRIIVIDNDLGQSGASAADREGFQRLVTEVSLGRAGIVLGLEVSRLARNSTDWHRLLEICALADALILDEDGVYDPAHFNDRLLLGLKGTMSEAELHVLRARLRGGILNKARRGELSIRPPIGFVYNPDAVLTLDPDQQVQHSLRLLFETYRRTGSASATVKTFHDQALLLPRRVSGGPQKGDLVWGPLGHCQTLRILHNPRYAGAFVFGRHHVRKTADGRSKIVAVAQSEWDTLIPAAHPGYLSWEEYEQNQRRLRENAQANGADRRRSPAREGPALLQGLLICGRCGWRMTVRYHVRNGRLNPDYICQRERIEKSQPICQHIPGHGIDEAITEMLIEAVSPVALEVALAVQQELQGRLDDADKLRLKQVARAQYEADLARRCYIASRPGQPAGCRFAGSGMEQQTARTHGSPATAGTSAAARPKRANRCAAGRYPGTGHRLPAAVARSTHARPGTQRMVRLSVEDITVNRAADITLRIRFKGGASKTLVAPVPLTAWQQRATNPDVVQEIDRLLDHNTDSSIASVLNEQGLFSGEGKAFTSKIVARIRRDYGLTSRYDRLRRAGMLTQREMATLLAITLQQVRIWRHHGILRGHPYTEKNECLYEHPGDCLPRKAQGQKLSERGHQNEVLSTPSSEVRCEA
jgi:DNA invertase Pin-like site-specific DNA recombinase